MSSQLRLQLTLLATTLGALALLLYTTLVQDVLFKGVTFCNATSLNLSLMVMGLWTAGLITGFLTALLVLQDNYYPNYILSAVAVGKLLFLVGCDSFSGPLWFDALEVSALVTGLWMGYYGGVKIPISPA